MAPAQPASKKEGAGIGAIRRDPEGRRQRLKGEATGNWTEAERGGQGRRGKTEREGKPE